VNHRLLALIMAFLVGSPVCWCCAQTEQQPVKKAVRSCCEAKREKEKSKPASQRENCPCAGSIAQRDLAKSTMVAPPAVLAAPVVIAVVEFVPHFVPVETGRVTPCNDTGPPPERTPLYLRQHALLL
jgi:hypothetical protein